MTKLTESQPKAKAVAVTKAKPLHAPRPPRTMQQHYPQILRDRFDARALACHMTGTFMND